MRIACLLPLLVAASLHAQDPWALMTQRDLDAMHAQILANHPGPADERNPEFSKWLEEGYAAASLKAKEVKSFGGYSGTLWFYAAGFRDGHLGLTFNIGHLTTVWPGFTIGLRGNRYVVAATEESSIPVGSEVVDCDGVAPRAMIERDLVPFYAGPLIESAWNYLAPWLLTDRGYPGVKRAENCRVRIGGEVQTIKLRYRRTPRETHAEHVQTAASDIKTTFEARRFGDGGIWVSIPTFQGNDAENLAGLKKLVEAAPSWRNAKMVVLDVRGNGGGNSAWGWEIAEGLWGNRYIKYVSDSSPRGQDQYVDWRVSKDNLAHLRDIVDSQTRQLGADHPTTRSFRNLIEGMEAALGRGEKLYGPRSTKTWKAPDGPAPPPATNARVFFLTDGRCGSSCLDFADLLERIPGITHAGRMTYADSVYMEVRGAGLPSNAATLNLPTKVYRGRVRGHNEPYAPDVVFEGDMADTAALERWIDGLMKRP